MTTAAGTMRALGIEIVDGVAILTLDLPGAPVNILSKQVREEMAQALDVLERDQSVRAAVLISGKPDIFIAGADIEEFLTLATAEDARRLSAEGHQMLNRLERMRFPVVAAIHGACMGGGVETALACTYRVASDHPKTILALSEVKLGLIPGGGGTQRLPRLVGLRAALDMILTGKNVHPRKARAIGLVDEIVHPAILRDVAIARARELAAGTRTPASGPRSSGVSATLLDDNALGRTVVFRQAREQTLKSTHGHYPAPLAAIDAVRHGLAHGMEAGLAREAELFGEMAATDVSKQLIFLFFATTALKRDPGVPEPAPSPLPVDKIGVLGAGFMGSGIAAVAAMRGTIVRLKDTDPARVGKGLAAVREILKEPLVRKRITRQQFEDQLILVGGTTDYSGFDDADLVIEAVFEDLQLKHQVLRDTERHLPERAVYASNTSTIPIARIAQAAARPDRVLGMHFFSPVQKMPLLEVVVTEQTSKEATVTAVAYGRKIGKTVIVVGDGPGFYTSRILAAYLNEAGKLLDEGAAIEAIDHALVDFGFPVGPVTLLDEIGIDVAGKAGNVIADAFGSRMEPSAALQRVVSAGRYGRKARKGFYRYDEHGKKKGVDESVYELLPTGRQRTTIAESEIQQRCVLAMVNEAARCLEEGILRSPRDGDIGAVFGLGFPPFRGGPFRYIDSVGAAQIVEQLQALDRRFPPRFLPAGILIQMAERGERFYPAAGKPVA